MSDATDIGDELLSLAQGKVPASKKWLGEVWLNRGDLPASRNKFLACNAAELFFAWIRNDLSRVREVLDWWTWFAGTPFTEGEDLTSEEVYRSLMAYSAWGAAAMAFATDNQPALVACRKLAMAHPAWLAVGASPSPGRKVTDHLLKSVGKPVLLRGDGGLACAYPYPVQPGKRGMIRNRDKKGKPTFLFADHVGLSVMLAQAAGFAVPRKLAPWQVDLGKALTAFAPGLGPFGFNPESQRLLNQFLASPSSVDRARPLLGWLLCPSLEFEFIRYESGAVAAYCGESTTSSTDQFMFDIWYPGGETVKGSADDGLRESTPKQIAWEDGASISCRFASGGAVVSAAKPGGREVWRISAKDGKVLLSHLGPDNPPTPPPVPTVPPKKLRRRRWWDRLFV